MPRTKLRRNEQELYSVSPSPEFPVVLIIASPLVEAECDATLRGWFRTKSPTERNEGSLLDWSEARSMNLELCTLAGLTDGPCACVSTGCYATLVCEQPVARRLLLYMSTAGTIVAAVTCDDLQIVGEYRMKGVRARPWNW
jgi:hypothetical protein